MKFLVVLFVLLILLFVWVVCIKLSVTAKRNRVLYSFKELDMVLQKRYKVLQTVLNAVKNADLSRKSQSEYCESLMAEAISLGTKAQNIDRRIAFDTELKKNADQIIEAVCENSQFQNNAELRSAIDEYNNYNSEIKETVKKYNDDAHVLRLAADVFPSSFIARLSKIKYFDSI